MKTLFKKLDEKATVKNTLHFFNHDLERLTLLCGCKLVDLSSPQLSLAPAHSSGGNHNEDALIEGVTADMTIQAVAAAIAHLPTNSQKLVIGTQLEHKTNVEMQRSLALEHTQVVKLKKQALLDFADAFIYWQHHYKCSPVLDLHEYAA